MYDPMKFCTAEKREGWDQPWFAVDPQAMYPATITRILEVVESGEKPVELGSAEAQLMSFVLAVPEGGWDLARESRDDVTGKAEVAARTAALEVARLWFTQAMQVKHGSVGLRILAGDKSHRL